MQRLNLMTLVGIVAICLALVPFQTEAQDLPDDGWVYFEETGHHVPELFVEAWWRFGGLPIVGYPVSEPFERDGMIVQHFERVVMEWHTQHAGTPYEVQLELLGNWTATGHTDPAFDPLPENPLGDDDSGFWFVETGHTLQNGFQQYWQNYGGLQVFGFPISQEFDEDGRTVQYFERARFEWWPEHAGTVYEVQLGHLGVESGIEAGVDMQPVERRDGVPIFTMNPPQRDLHLPTLMYHQFDDDESRYTISMWRFEQQLTWLRDNGYTAITMSEAYDYFYGYGSLPDKPVILTFDDGWWSHWDVAAVLDRYEMPGVFFITLDEQPRMSDAQIADLAARGHEIGGHTNLHPDLTTVSDDRLRTEVTGNRQRLQEISGAPVDFFAYPYGAYDGRVIAAVEAAGYRGAVAAWGGTGWSSDLRWNQPRVEITGGISLDEFASIVR